MILEHESITERFESLAKQWKADTALLSSATALVSHPAYQRIIALGSAVVPLLLCDLERESTHPPAALPRGR